MRACGGLRGVVPPGQHHWYARPEARQWRCEPPSADPLRFHAHLPGYRPTELVEVPALAEELEVRRVFVKDESGRLGLGAFKVLGASWAVARTLAGAGAVPDLADLRAIAARAQVELVTATDGNHGRAVGYLGRVLGLRVRVFIPDGVPASAAAMIAAEGATVTVVSEPYDEAVELAARYASAEPDRVLVQDTAWPGYEQVPGWIVEGYETLLSEVDAQLSERSLSGPDLVSVPVGVGSLAQAVVAHYRSRPADVNGGPAVLGVEPDAAPCLLASLLAGEYRSIETGPTVMAGLNCGTASSLAWSVLSAGLDAAIAVPDEAAIAAVVGLARYGIQAGPSGAASLAGVCVALTGAGAASRRAQLGVTSRSVVVMLSTEGQAAQ